jgi:zinc transporter ZupT
MITRIVTALMGLLFGGCGAYLAFDLAGSDWQIAVLAGVLLLLGVEMLVAAAKGRPSLLSRLGPLP